MSKILTIRYCARLLTLEGGGWLGTKFWVDPASGVAGVTGLHLLCPISGFADPDVLKATAKFEELLYGSLETGVPRLSKL